MQDPVIFSGTVRSNLDPFQQASSDAAIMEAVAQAGMDGFVRELEVRGMSVSVTCLGYAVGEACVVGCLARSGGEMALWRAQVMPLAGILKQ